MMIAKTEKVKRENKGSASGVEVLLWFCKLVLGSVGSLFSLLQLRLVHDVSGCMFTGVTFNNHLNSKLDFLDLHGCKAA